MKPLILFILSVVMPSICRADDVGNGHWERVSALPGLKENAEVRKLKLGPAQVVQPKPDQAHPTGLAPVAHARLLDAAGKPTQGYVQWAPKSGQLLEFAVDVPLPKEWQEPGEATKPFAISNISALQQFSVPKKEKPKAGSPNMASGCVPTAGGTLLSHWQARGYPQLKDARDETLQLRNRLKMTLFPDTDGYTADGMDLAGAFPFALADALNSRLTDTGSRLGATFSAFSKKLAASEIRAGRPILVSCVIRLPLRPELSWGHEMVASGVLQLGTGKEESCFFGLLDNFYPTEHKQTLRWVRSQALDSLITVKPLAE